jgi:uncharacterized membrane protein YgcG
LPLSRVLNVRLHSDDGSTPGPGGAGGRTVGDVSGGAAPLGRPESRLNLLLSYAGWQPDPWVNRLPPLLEPMGVQSLCAGSGRQATDMIRRVPIHIAVVDLALPLDESSGTTEEGGSRLLDILARLSQPPPTVVIKRSRSHRDDHRDITAALRAGAFAVIDRPRDARDLELMLDVLRRCLARFYEGRWPGCVGPSGSGGGSGSEGGGSSSGGGGGGGGYWIPPNTV